MYINPLLAPPSLTNPPLPNPRHTHATSITSKILHQKSDHGDERATFKVTNRDVSTSSVPSIYKHVFPDQEFDSKIISDKGWFVQTQGCK